MEWQSFLIGMGVMMVLMAVVFALIPDHGKKKSDAQMETLKEYLMSNRDFWRQNIEIATANQRHFESIAGDLRTIMY